MAGCAHVFAVACSDDSSDTETDPDRQPLPGDPDFVRDPALDIDLYSAASSNASHEPGNNCMRCHQRLGGGPGLFTAAGTLFDAAGQPRTGAVVEIRTAPAGEGDLLATLEVDQLGNFYTTTVFTTSAPPARTRARAPGSSSSRGTPPIRERCGCLRFATSR